MNRSVRTAVAVSAVVSVIIAGCSIADDRGPAPRRTNRTPTARSDNRTLVAVVEERAGRVAILGERKPPADCDRDGLTEGCWFGPFGVIRTHAVPPAPHNAAGRGRVVLVTHPSTGSLSRIDVESGDVRTTGLGVEPHDVKFTPDGTGAIVADEEGRRLHFVDPATLETTSSLAMPGRAHDLVVDGDDIWVTLVGRDELARVRGHQIDLFDTGMSPHDLIIDGDGRIVFSNWESPALGLFDPATSETTEGPAGVDEPHHFAVEREGIVWVTDNGSGAVVGVPRDGKPTRIEVGPMPHHLTFAGDRMVVAVSGAGEAVVIERGRVVGRVRLSAGLHGVAVVEATIPATVRSNG